jgi:hypothetical protein
MTLARPAESRAPVRDLLVRGVMEVKESPAGEAARPMRTSPWVRTETPSRVEFDAEACRNRFRESLVAAETSETPFRHWILERMLPDAVAAELDRLPFPAPDLGGESGSRELHNATRRYLDPQAIAAFPVCRCVAEAFQSGETVALIEALTGANLDGCWLRIEFALDADGFWLRPHTDLGVKRFTLLHYLAPDGCPELGTDLYRDAETWSHRSRFEPGAALAFVPSDTTWHGFEPRPIPVVRKSLIYNYVTDAWRAREQLSWPDRPVRSRG